MGIFTDSPGVGPGATPGTPAAPAAGPAVTTRSKDRTNLQRGLYPFFSGKIHDKFFWEVFSMTCPHLERLPE